MKKLRATMGKPEKAFATRIYTQWPSGDNMSAPSILAHGIPAELGDLIHEGTLQTDQLGDGYMLIDPNNVKAALTLLRLRGYKATAR